MLVLSRSVRIFVHRYDTDMRKSFDGLSAIVNSAKRSQQELSGVNGSWISTPRKKSALFTSVIR